MKRGLCLLCVGSLAASMAADGINAEVHRLSMSEIVAAMVDAQEAREGELGRVSFSASEFAATLPDVARVVATDSDAGPPTVVYVILDRQGDAIAHRVGGGRLQLKIVQGPEGETRSTNTDANYLSEWVRPHL